MTTAHANTGIKRDAMTEYYGYARRVAATIERLAAQDNVSIESKGRQVQADRELLAWVRYKSLQGTEAERISPQDTANIVGYVAAGHLRA